MRVDRRSFLQYCVASAASLGLDLSELGRLKGALAAGTAPTVVWLSAANCTGCTVSFANLFEPSEPTDVADVLINHINLAYHPNLMGAAGDLAVGALNDATKVAKNYVLVVEGGIPNLFGGHTCTLWTEYGLDGKRRDVTAKEAVNRFARQAKAVLSVGTCASFGGIPAGAPNPTGIQSVQAATGVTTVNIPGCPTHPEWIAWTVAQFLAGATIRLDASGRPATLFSGEGKIVHKQCPRLEAGEASRLGVEGLCLKELGCKGEITQGDCPTRLWNSRTNWCVGANSLCLGCTERRFPDGFSPFYKTV